MRAKRGCGCASSREHDIRPKDVLAPVAHRGALMAEVMREDEAQRFHFYLEIARRWSSSSGEVEMALRTLELEVRMAEGRTDEARAYARRGSEIAELGGFGGFRDVFYLTMGTTG